ncbi:hypothetical protein [Leisingera caerulea]|uniref:Uncharacterized protein n=1 Tax=Leisingera caerulea TaxID=506591 RepID=A0A9Q9HKY3_LEICA|nr:hypothetical protein [Leisingera caerulea]UWQ56012.1 hypothetical protein K3721_18835 [Leisingera caerulea]
MDLVNSHTAGRSGHSPQAQYDRPRTTDLCKKQALRHQLDCGIKLILGHCASLIWINQGWLRCTWHLFEGKRMGYTLGGRTIWFAFLLLPVLSVAALLFYSTFKNTSVSQGDQSHPSYPLVMRLSGEIEFDGTVVPVDQPVACEGHRPETGRGLGRAIMVPAYQPVIKMSDGRGWIRLTPGLNICRLYANVWAPDEPDLPQITPPEGYVPAIEFFEHRPKTDFRTDPTVPGDGVYETIAFNSYRAISNPNNRLTVTRPFDITLEPFPPSVALLAEVARQESVNKDFQSRPVRLQVNRVEGGSRFDTIPPGYFTQLSPWVKIVPEGIWRNPQTDIFYQYDVEMIERKYDTGLLARVIDRMVDLPEDAIIALDRDLIDAEPLAEGKKYGPIGLLPHNRQRAGPLVYAGIPQPGIERKGLLYTAETASHKMNFSEADRIPFLCKEKVLVPAFELQGQSFSFFPACPLDGFKFQVPGRKVIHRPIKYRGGVHLYLDTRTMDLWYVFFKG